MERQEPQPQLARQDLAQQANWALENEITSLLAQCAHLEDMIGLEMEAQGLGYDTETPNWDLPTEQ